MTTGMTIELLIHPAVHIPMNLSHNDPICVRGVQRERGVTPKQLAAYIDPDWRVFSLELPPPLIHPPHHLTPYPNSTYYVYGATGHPYL